MDAPVTQDPTQNPEVPETIPEVHETETSAKDTPKVEELESARGGALSRNKSKSAREAFGKTENTLSKAKSQSEFGLSDDKVYDSNGMFEKTAVSGMNVKEKYNDFIE